MAVNLTGTMTPMHPFEGIRYDSEEDEYLEEPKPRGKRMEERHRSWERSEGRQLTRRGSDPEPHSQWLSAEKLCPLVVKGQGQAASYVPWSFMDMVGLAARLPALTEGANKWIIALEESMAGVTLALGDIKALLMHMAGKHWTTTEEIFTGAGIPGAATGARHNEVGFGGHRTVVWAELRKRYPEKMDPSRLEGEKLKDDECPSKFLHDFQRKWRDETGSIWNTNQTSQNLFKMMVKKAMPSDVQQRLNSVVGLAKMEWPLFLEHIIHHVEDCRRMRQEAEEQNKQLANKLTQLQLGELAKQLKKDKTKTQAPVVVNTPTQSTEEPTTPAPVMYVAPVQPQAGQVPTQTAPDGPTTNHFPPIHLHINPQGNYRPTPGRGRPIQQEGRPRRGGWRGGPPVQRNDSRNHAPQPPQPRGPQAQEQNDQRRQQYRRTQSTPTLGADPMGQSRECWGCGELGHIRRDCPNNPWMGPAAEWD